MPVVFSKYWFFTDYLVIVFLAPFINSGMQALKKQGLTVGLIILSIVWFVIPLVTTFIFNRSVVVVSNDFVLLTFTYVLGAYFRLHETLVMKSWKMNFYLVLSAAVLMLTSVCFFLRKGEVTHNVRISNLAYQFFPFTVYLC